MNILQIFTASGLTQALHAHHKRLHEKYGFAPLSGKKSIHKFAESFGFDNAEPFLAKLTAMSERMLNTSVNLSISGISSIVHVSVEEDDGEHQFRVMVENGRAFIIHNVDPALLAPALVSYLGHNVAIITIGMFVVRITLKEEGVCARLVQAKSMEEINGNDPAVDDEARFHLLEESYHYFDGNVDFGWTPEDEEELMDSFREAMNGQLAANQEHVIPALVVSDDEQVHIEFDAVRYFESELESGNIEYVFEALDSCNFDAGCPTDTIAEFFAKGVTKRLFDYLYSIDESVEVGYRCTINREASLKWFHQKDMVRVSLH